MCFVVDASVAFKRLVAEEHADIADQLAAGGEGLHAPRLAASEIANTLWRKARAGQIERAEAGAAMTLLADMPVRWNDDETVSADAVRPALAFHHPVHDCVYLERAHRMGATVVAAVAATEHDEAVVTLADCAGTC